jgi:hypothetical protein
MHTLGVRRHLNIRLLQLALCAPVARALAVLRPRHRSAAHAVYYLARAGSAMLCLRQKSFARTLRSACSVLAWQVPKAPPPSRQSTAPQAVVVSCVGQMKTRPHASQLMGNACRVRKAVGTQANA